MEITLRRAQIEDSRLVWTWANDPAVRAASFTTDFIPYDQHVVWFEAKLKSDQDIMLIVETERPIGVVRFAFQDEDDAAVISINLDAAVRGHGYGSQTIQAASDYLFATTSVQLIHAYIKPGNIASQRAFSKAGYELRENTMVKQEAALDLVRKRDEQL